MRPMPSFNGKIGFVLGLIAAAVLMPATVLAAASLVRIQSGTGTATANVDGAHQLLVAEADPKSFLSTGYLAVANGSCTLLRAPITGKGIIITQARFITQTSPAFDASHGFIVWRNSTCNGADALIVFPDSLGSQTETLAPGLPVSGGNGISAQAFGTGLTGELQINGYTVPDTAVP